MAQAQTNTRPAPDKAIAIRDNINIARDFIAKAQPEIAKTLPAYITSDKFVRTAQSAIVHTRNIDKVSDPRSLLAACLKAAADGLILDGREAALVVDGKGEVQYRPMMRGLLKLAYNSGQIKSVVVETVRDNDLFDYSPTRADEPVVHKIDLRQPRGDVYAVYAVCTLLTGGVLHDVMSLEDVNRIRDRSDAWKAYRADKIKSTPWSTDWSEMARKTVFRRLSKYMPSSSDRNAFQQAVERIDEDFTFDEPAADTAATPAPAGRKRRGGAAAVLKDVTPRPQPGPADDITDHDPETGEIVDADDTERQYDDDI